MCICMDVDVDVKVALDKSRSSCKCGLGHTCSRFRFRCRRRCIWNHSINCKEFDWHILKYLQLCILSKSVKISGSKLPKCSRAAKFSNISKIKQRKETKPSSNENLFHWDSQSNFLCFPADNVCCDKYIFICMYISLVEAFRIVCVYICIYIYSIYRMCVRIDILFCDTIVLFVL